jgi:putative membrane protein
MSIKGVVKLSFALGAIVIAFLFWWIYFREVNQSTFTWTIHLPLVNAILNTITATLLCLGYLAIKNGNKEKHKKFMLAATATSACFLISYLVYHYFQGDTKFLAKGLIRYLYFFILISHILLSIVQVPLILMTLLFAFTQKFNAHKKIAPWTFWIWLYVSVTGVLVFIFLKYFNI